MKQAFRGIGAAAAAGLVVLLAFAAPRADAVEPSHLSMAVGNLTSQPIGHYDFCKRRPAECNLRSQSAPAPSVTEYGWEVVHEINHSVNRAIKPMTDMEMHGVEEYWSYPTTVGDCEDYALLKRRMLMERGFSEQDLLLTVVRRPNGEGHAVLTLRTDEGDFILDNLDDEVRLWTETPYRFLKRQASFHTGRWVSIENSADVLVGSLN